MQAAAGSRGERVGRRAAARLPSLYHDQGLRTLAGWVFLVVSELQRSRIIKPITKSSTG
jgi:hypothetical protein